MHLKSDHFAVNNSSILLPHVLDAMSSTGSCCRPPTPEHYIIRILIFLEKKYYGVPLCFLRQRSEATSGVIIPDPVLFSVRVSVSPDDARTRQRGARQSGDHHCYSVIVYNSHTCLTTRGALTIEF